MDAIVIALLISGAIGAVIAATRGWSSGRGAALGCLLGPIGWALTAFFAPGKRNCPHCKERIHNDAMVCPRCRSAVTPVGKGTAFYVIWGFIAALGVLVVLGVLNTR